MQWAIKLWVQQRNETTHASRLVGKAEKWVALSETRQLAFWSPQRSNGDAHFAFLVKDKECLSGLDQDRL
jgi:hypothetical protein